MWVWNLLLSVAAIVEILGILFERRLTLTYWIRKRFGIEDNKPGYLWAEWGFAVGVLVLTLWLIPHIVWGWWGGAS